MSDEANIAQLDHLRDITAKLADPRKISGCRCEATNRRRQAVLLGVRLDPFARDGVTGNVDGAGVPPGGGRSPFIQNIRKNAVFLITPIVEVDGHDRVVDSWNYKKANPDKPLPDLVYWGHYVQHDNNRDGIAMGLKLSQMMMQDFFYWHPQVLHDLHESDSISLRFYGNGPV